MKKNDTIRNTVFKIVLFLLIWKIIILAATAIADPYLKDDNLFIPRPNSIAKNIKLVRVFGNFDGVIYTDIARKGYTEAEAPFFPLFPLFTWILSKLTLSRHFLPHALLISHLAFIGSLIFIYKLLKLDEQSTLFSFFVLTILTFPTSFYYGAAYNDALFFLFATGTIYFARKHSWALSSIYGMLATFTRLNGLALFFYIGFEYISFINKVEYFHQLKLQKDIVLKYLKKCFNIKTIIQTKIYTIFLIPAAYFLYLAYLQFKFGTYMVMFSSMKTWGQDKMTFPLQVFWRYFKIVFLYPTFKLNYWVAVVELAFVLLYVFILIYSFKKIRISYWVFIFLSFLIPSLTGTFQGMPRYALHLYPFFLALALLLKNSVLWQKVLYFSISISLLIVLLILYTNGYFVA